jgi:hypothetical protein
VLVLFADLIKELANALSAPSWVYVSSDYLPVQVLTVIFTVLLFLFLVLDIRKKKLSLVSLAMIFSSVFLLSGALTAYERSEEVSYTYSSNKSDCTVIKTQSKLFVIENGDFPVNDAYTIIDVIHNEKATYLDDFILTSLSDSTCNAVQRLMNNVRIETIRVPIPKTEYELAFCETLALLLSKYGTVMKFYDGTLALEEYSFDLIYRTTYSANDHSEIIYTLTYDNVSYAYLSSNVHQIATNHALTYLSKCEYVILGYTGSVSEDFDLYIPNIDAIIINGGRKISDNAQEFYKENSTGFFHTKNISILFK